MTNRLIGSDARLHEVSYIFITHIYYTLNLPGGV